MFLDNYHFKRTKSEASTSPVLPFIFNSWPSFLRKGRLCNRAPDTEDIYHNSIFGSCAHSYSSGQLLGLKVFPLLFPESQKAHSLLV